MPIALSPRCGARFAVCPLRRCCAPAPCCARAAKDRAHRDSSRLYGADLEGVTLAGLLKELEQLSGLVRIRLSSLEPADITGELVECLAGSTVICPHLHIALQSGDGEILQRMNRSYSPEEYLTW